ncbi:hypothetical protein JCM12141A_04190 [Mycolicibacterium hodleri]
MATSRVAGRSQVLVLMENVPYGPIDAPRQLQMLVCEVKLKNQPATGFRNPCGNDSGESSQIVVGPPGA